MIEVLKTYEIKQKELLLQFGNKIGKKDFIFYQYDRQPPFPDSVSTWCPKYLQKINLPKISFHCLRHTHASLLLMAGASLSKVSERLGHSSYVITVDRYSHLLPQQEQNMVDKLDSVILN